MDSSGPWDCRGGDRSWSPVLFDLLERVCVCLQPNDMYLCPTIKQITKMGEQKNVLSEVHLKYKCVGEMRRLTLSQVPPQFIFQSKSGSFYSVQPHHKCTFSLFPAVKYTGLSLVYKEIISKKLHPRPMLAWTAHEETHIWRRDSRIVWLFSLYFVSYQQQYHIWTKEVLVFVYPRSTIRLFYWTHR